MTIHTGSRVYVGDGTTPGVGGLVVSETVTNPDTGSRMYGVRWDDGDETWEIAADITEDDPFIPTLREILADDASSFPDGHPCRDCGRLFKDHPTDFCEGWR